MADIGRAESLHHENQALGIIKTLDLINPDDNPLLKTREKIFIKALVRGTSFTLSENPTEVQAKGISPETVETLRKMATSHNGLRKPFSLMVDEFNSKNISDSPIQLTNPKTSSALTTAVSGAIGDLDGVIKRVSEGKGNCMEFSLTMQLMAKVFYPDVIEESELLAYSEKTNLFGEIAPESRHFYLFTKLKNAKEGEEYLLTPYAGRQHKISKNEALWWIENANKKGEFGLKNIYIGLVSLIDRSKAKK